MTPHSRIGALVVLLLPALALAQVGKVEKVEGEASRTPKDGAPVALSVGSEIHVHDLILVKAGNLKMVLNDGSVLMLAQGSKLEIKAADFEKLERKGFFAKLSLGKLWTKVVGGGKYEVTTDKAVAGVRGTIFRVDADTLLKSAVSGRTVKATVVRVTEGGVNVVPTPEVVKASMAAQKGAKKAPKGPRKEVPPPFEEVSVEEWEKKFADLQANSQVAVGVDLWELAEYEAAAKQDAFAKWVDSNR